MYWCLKFFFFFFIFSIVAVFNEEHDIGTFTVKTVDDPRALNKVVYIRPPKNSVSFNELVAVWEKKIGKTLEKEYIPEEQLLKNIQGDKKFDFNFLNSLLYELLVYEWTISSQRLQFRSMLYYQLTMQFW